MKKYYNSMEDVQLFNNIPKKDFSFMFTCLGGFTKEYKKGDIILNQGDRISAVGIIVKGDVKITKVDYDGSEVIIGQVKQGDIFAEVFACAEITNSPVSIISNTCSVIVFIDYKKVISSCSISCNFHQQLISNMLKILASKSLYLNRRIDIISKKSLRGKILTYFHYVSMSERKFNITMNREELANFLCADRSALSNELSKMKKEGIIDYNKNEFILLK